METVNFQDFIIVDSIDCACVIQFAYGPIYKMFLNTKIIGLVDLGIVDKVLGWPVSTVLAVHGHQASFGIIA